MAARNASAAPESPKKCAKTLSRSSPETRLSSMPAETKNAAPPRCRDGFEVVEAMYLL
ncbi:MAG: hypothetical protein ABSE21_03200 [Bryobacteraceae bacterium]